MRRRLLMSALVLAVGGCRCNDDEPGLDAGTDAGLVDAGASDAGSTDAGVTDAGVTDAGALFDAGGADASVADGGDAGGADGGPGDAGADAGRVYSCGDVTLPSGWTIAPGFRGAVVLSADAGLAEPVALVFAGGAFGGDLYVVNQARDTVLRFDPTTRRVARAMETDAGLSLLTTIAWDEYERLSSPGQLYVGDQGSDGDRDSVLFRVSPDGGTVVLAGPGGPGLDDVYGLAFTPPVGGWAAGLLAGGDTDSPSGDEMGLVLSDGGVVGFSRVPGLQGIASLRDGGIIVSRPGGGGFAGPSGLTPLFPSGDAGTDFVTGIPGLHAVVEAPPGPFGGKLYAASWSSGRIISVEPDGGVADLASGLSLTNYDGNVLAFSPDGRLLMVADRSRSVVVCIEPVTP